MEKGRTYSFVISLEGPVHETPFGIFKVSRTVALAETEVFGTKEMMLKTFKKLVELFEKDTGVLMEEI